jgi:hypothetical protein
VLWRSTATTLCRGGVALLLVGVYDAVGSFCTHQQILVSVSIKSNQSCIFFFFTCWNTTPMRHSKYIHIMPWHPIWKQPNDTHLSYNSLLRTRCMSVLVPRGTFILQITVERTKESVLKHRQSCPTLLGTSVMCSGSSQLTSVHFS